MMKKDYYNTIVLQVEDLRTLATVQADACFNLKKLSSLMPETTYRQLKRVIITGCGDSFSAAGAMLPSFRLHSGLADVSVPDPMEFCRFYDEREILKGHRADETLVIAVSASGGSDRIVEIVQKGSTHHTASMLISNNPQSKGALASQYVYHVETPEGCNTPGLRSYFASMIAITALGAYVGMVQGHITQARFEQIKQSIVSYITACMAEFERIDDQMFSLAESWKAFERFEVVGDWNEGYSAQFVEEKFIECAGVHCTHIDTEDWCHINYFLRDPKTIGTIFLLPSKMEGFDRAQYSVASALNIGRPTLIVTDAPASAFPGEAVVCTLPAAEETWLVPIMDFVPGSLLGSYIAALSDKMFFGGRYNFRTRQWNQ